MPGNRILALLYKTKIFGSKIIAFITSDSKTDILKASYRNQDFVGKI
jgi:hypothetical protein